MANSSSSEMEKFSIEEKSISDGDQSISNERQTWSRKREFILALVGYSVGLGNVWRFPYLCYKNGGGAFLIPYALSVIFAGIPMFFLEVSLGQYTRQSAVKVWDTLVPSMKGIGYGSAVINFLFALYYMVVMAWTGLYLVHSFIPGSLPWATCGNWWNTDMCEDTWNATNVMNTTVSLMKSNFSSNVTGLSLAVNGTSPAQEFWKYYVLRISSGVEELGGFSNWPLTGCFLASWIVIYFCVFKGVKSSGKAVYISATLPYVMLFILLIRGLTLDGAVDGVLYFLKPDFSKLKSAKVWVEAGSQIFYSYGICFTVLITFGSYNTFRNDCYKQSIILASSCSLTSFLASFTIFSILGHMALIESKDISEVATQGPGLVFQVYPTGLSLLPCPRLWAILFFITLFMVGIDTQFCGVEGTIAIVLDQFPWLEKGKYGREKATAMIALTFFVLGLPFLTNGGIYVFELFNWYACSGICLLFLTFFQSIAIGWIYGADRYFENVKEMTGYLPSPYFKYCYRFFTPLLTMLIFIFYCANYSPLVLNSYVYPVWANVVGWVLSFASILCVPGYFIYYLTQMRGSFKERIYSSLHLTSLPGSTDKITEKV